MAREEVVSCDVCGESGAKPWVLIQEERRWEADLCEKHSTPLVKVAEKGRSILDTSGPRSRTLRAYDRTFRG